MQNRDKPALFDVLTDTAALYGKELSPGVLAMYFADLQAFDLQSVEIALAKHRQLPDRDSAFFPRPGELIRMLTGGTQDQAQLAWAKVDAAVRRVGPHVDVAFDDPLIHVVIVEMGGWIGICGKELKEWPFVANEFRTRYQGYTMRGDCPRYTAVLIGIANASNGAEGQQKQAPVLIGNAQSAAQVLARGDDRPALGFTRLDALPAPQLQQLENSSKTLTRSNAR